MHFYKEQNMLILSHVFLQLRDAYPIFEQQKSQVKPTIEQQFQVKSTTGAELKERDDYTP